MPTLAVVCPAFNEEEVVPEFCHEPAVLSTPRAA
jgi:hypothetical protein